MSTTFRYHNSAFRRAGYLAMFALLVLAIIFYEERAYLLDIAFQTFLMINDGTLQVMVNRFGSGIVQMLPLLAIRAEAPIWVVSLLYSVSFPLLYLLFYTIIVRVFKNDYLGWTLVFLFTLIVHDAFYWATSEQQQGLAALLVYFSFLLRYPHLQAWWMLAIGLLGTVVLAYYHPLIFIPFYFLWGFFALHQPTRRTNWRYWLLAAFMLAVLAFKSYYSANWYDTSKTSDFTRHLREYFPRYWELPSNRKFLHNCLQYWYLFPAFLIVNTVYYLWQRHWLKLGWLLAFCFGHLLLLHISSPNATYRFYVEVNYMVLSIYVMVPFLFDLAPRIPARWRLGLFVGIAVWRLATIAAHHQPYEVRVTWIRTQLEHTGPSGKAYLPTADAPMDLLLMDWALPYESLVISAADANVQRSFRTTLPPARTLFLHPDPAQFQADLQRDSTLVTSFKVYDYTQLNMKYFPLPPGPYTPLPAN